MNPPVLVDRGIFLCFLHLLYHITIITWSPIQEREQIIHLLKHIKEFSGQLPGKDTVSVQRLRDRGEELTGHTGCNRRDSGSTAL
jgi:hypothetical protein